MRKIFYLLVSFSLVFASCSMNRYSINTTHLQSDKLQTVQLLTAGQPGQKQLATENVPMAQNADQTLATIPTGNLSRVKGSVDHKVSKTFARNNFIKKARKNLAYAVTIPNATNAVNRFIKKPAPIASYNGRQLFDGANYLLLWIIFLVV